MSIKKLWIIPGCIACGECQDICPEVFYVSDECHIIQDTDLNKNAEKIKEAADICPVEVIKYDE